MLKKYIRIALWRRKMRFWQQCGKNFAGSPKVSGLFSGKDKKIYFWQKFDSLQKDHLHKGNAFWETYQKFSKNSENLRLESLKSYKKFCFSREPFSLKMTLCTRRSQFWQPCRDFFPPKVRFFMPKVQKSKKSTTLFVNTNFF